MSGNALREYVYLDGQPLAQVLTSDIGLQRPPFVTGAQSAAGEPWLWVVLVVLLALVVRAKRPQAAALLLAVLLMTCVGGDEAQAPASGDSPQPAARSHHDPIYWHHNDR